MIDFSKVKAITIPEGKVKRIQRGSTVLWKSGYTNQVPISINTDGSIYNGGKGYKDDYRIRSGGAEAGYTSVSITGYIPAKAGDHVRLSGYDALALGGGPANAINLYNDGFANQGQLVVNVPATGYGIMQEAANKAYNWDSITENPTGVYNWIVPPDSRIAYIRVTGFTSPTGENADGSRMIVTVNEEITD